MRSFTVTLNTTLLFGALLISSSCNGQTRTQVADAAHGPNPPTGRAVSAIDTSIWYVFQDSKGLYWFGSNGQGVYRYDARLAAGKNLIHFSSIDGLCDDQLRGIQEDKSGNIYFNTVNGVSKFDGRTFTKLRITRNNHPNGGWRLHPDDLWFQGAQDSGVVYRYDGATLYRLELPKNREGEAFIAAHPRSKFPYINFSPYDVYGIHKDRMGNVWFGTNVGLCRYDGKAFAWMTEDELGIGAIAYHVRSVIEDRRGYFWFSNIMHRFNIYQNREQPTQQAGSISYKKEKGIVGPDHDAAYFLSGLEDNRGDLWMVTYSKGVWRYDGKNLQHYEVKDGNENVLLFSIYKDSKGGLWVGTHSDGVYRYNGKGFEKFKL